MQYANLTSEINKVNILVSDKIEANDFYFFTHDKNPKITLSLFKKMIELKGLKFSKKANFYFVDRKKDINDIRQNEQIKNIYSLVLKNNSSDDIKNVLSLNDINATYSKSNKIFFKTDEETYNQIMNQIPNLDVDLKQVKIKLTIIETDLIKAKDRSVEIKSFLKSTNSTLTQHINLLTMPYSQSTNLISHEAPNFYGVLKFLDSNGISKIKSSPLLTAKNNTKVFFNVVKNIPYLTQNKKIQDSKQTEENSYGYKDVGLKVNLNPTILNDGVDIDLHLILEDVLSDGLTPVISKKELKSSYNVKYNQILVLSGLNKDISFKDEFSIPILSKIWLLGELFKFQTSKTNKTTLSLILEVIK